MSALFDGLLKPGDGGRLAIKRELERRRDAWDRPGYLYRGAGDYLLKHGRYYQGRELPEQYRDLPTNDNQCFDNAVHAAMQHPELRYCEGVYSTGHNHYTPHAWCVDADDEVVEVTYPTYGTENYRDEFNMRIAPPERFAYWGVIFRPELVIWHLEDTGEVCMFDRPVADRQSAMALRLGETFYGQDHDFPILKVPYDPARSSL